MNPRYPEVALRAGHRCEYCLAPEFDFCTFLGYVFHPVQKLPHFLRWYLLERVEENRRTLHKPRDTRIFRTKVG
jgi:hypothetical protein